MKKFENLDYSERKEIAKLFASWLRCYTHEVIVKVLERRDEILNNEATMHLLRELHERSEKEHNDFVMSLGCMLEAFDDFREYDPHNHATTHAGSYRDVLYDLYIR